MLVTLIRLPLVAPRGSVNNEPTPPIGLAYIASTLKSRGFRVVGIDATGRALDRIKVVPGGRLQYNGIDVEDVIGLIPEAPRVIGVSVNFSHEWTVVRDAIAEIRRARPETLIVIGGEHATALAEYSLNDCPAIDVCILGEGEETMLRLCQAVRDGENLSGVEGIGFLKDGEFIATPRRTRIREVNDIPRPDWETFPIEPYLDNAISFGAGFGRNMPLMASRGCPFQCTFCSNPVMWTTRYYIRSPEDVVREIKDYIEKYNITGIQFYDLTAIIKKPWVLDFCRLLKENGITLDWSLPAGTRSEALDDEALKALSEVNLKYLVYAPESGSPITLGLIKKKIKLDRMTKSIRAAIRNGIVVRTNLIIGFPHETRSRIFKTLFQQLKYSLMGVDEAPLYPFQPYPGTELFDYLLKAGKVELSDDYFNALATLSTGKLSPPDASYCEHCGRLELYAYRLLGLMMSYGLSYLIRPGRILRTLRNISGNQSATVLEQRLQDQFRKFTAGKKRDA